MKGPFKLESHHYKYWDNKNEYFLKSDEFVNKNHNFDYHTASVFNKETAQQMRKRLLNFG